MTDFTQIAPIKIKGYVSRKRVTCRAAAGWNAVGLQLLVSRHSCVEIFFPLPSPFFVLVNMNTPAGVAAMQLANTGAAAATDDFND